MFGLGFGEILIIALLAILLFGNDKLPQNLKKAAKGLSDLKRITGDAQRQWTDMRDDVARTLLTEEEANPNPASPPPPHLEEPVIQTEDGPMRHTADGRLVPVERMEEAPQAGLAPAAPLPLIRPADGAVARDADGGAHPTDSRPDDAAPVSGGGERMGNTPVPQEGNGNRGRQIKETNK